MANIAQMINVLQAMILTDKEKMVLTPTYHAFKMYVPFQDAKLVPVQFDAGSYVTGTFACRVWMPSPAWMLPESSGWK